MLDRSQADVKLLLHDTAFRGNVPIPEGFIAFIPEEVVECGVTSGEFRVYLRYRVACGEADHCVTTIGELAKSCRRSTRTVAKMIDKLVGRGLITCEKV